MDKLILNNDINYNLLIDTLNSSTAFSRVSFPTLNAWEE